MIWFVRLISIVFLLSAPANAQDNDKFIVVSASFNPVMSPKGPGDVFADCAKDKFCALAMNAAATYLGVPSSIIAASTIVAPSLNRKGQGSSMSIRLPAGYEYCKTIIRINSVVPAEGSRASAMSASSYKDGVGISAWTDQQGVGGGRTWVDAVFNVFGVRSDLASAAREQGVCFPYDRTLIDCRGSKGKGSHGHPACKGTEG